MVDGPSPFSDGPRRDRLLPTGSGRVLLPYTLSHRVHDRLLHPSTSSLSPASPWFSVLHRHHWSLVHLSGHPRGIALGRHPILPQPISLFLFITFLLRIPFSLHSLRSSVFLFPQTSQPIPRQFAYLFRGQPTIITFLYPYLFRIFLIYPFLFGLFCLSSNTPQPIPRQLAYFSFEVNLSSSHSYTHMCSASLDLFWSLLRVLGNIIFLFIINRPLSYTFSRPIQVLAI